MTGLELINNNYLTILSAQIHCINELLDGRTERLSITHCDSSYCIEKNAPEPDHAMVLFQGKGRACHLFLNGYLACVMVLEA